MCEYEYAESGVLLTFRELTLLLQSVGVRYINGFCLSESEISDEEVIQLIGSLVRKGILKTSDTEFYMEDMVEKMIRCIGWPDEDYEIEQENGQIYCYEKEEYALVTKIYPVREKTLELILYSKEEFQQKIRKEEIL